ncbi:hypothetical protein ABT186_22420 [Streptomyces sp. NPDC001634]|uniref:hypothetical protein n=1 Tax=Streptomyces sp. NPDC001634 TaxID=3154390 RepID=UPI00331661C5
MFVADGDAQGFVEWAFLVGVTCVDALCNGSKTLGDLSDLLSVEWGFLLPGDRGARVKLLPRRLVVSLRLVDPLAWLSASMVAASRSGAKARAIH